MNVSDAVMARISTRAFLDRPVKAETVREILDVAKFSPSGGNLQPWKAYVVMGAARQRLIETVKRAVAVNPFANEGELAIYPEKLWEPYRTRRFEVGEALYALLGIPRDDKPARLRHLASNFAFFGAPVGLFFSLDRRFDKGQWAHLGMFMQTIALLAVERGLSTCMQEAWATRAKTVSDFLGLGDGEQLYCGMALGYADPEAPANRLRSERVPLDDFVRFFTD
ncbi:MAG: nitroreductase [Pseudomonadota bacterium]|nr:nitroreductase [Pseudomonadota bacterium]